MDWFRDDVAYVVVQELWRDVAVNGRVWLSDFLQCSSNFMSGYGEILGHNGGFVINIFFFEISHP